MSLLTVSCEIAGRDIHLIFDYRKTLKAKHVPLCFLFIIFGTVFR